MTVILLEPQQEVRILPAEGRAAVVTLVDGTAELFGCSLLIGVQHHVRDESFAVFSWTGATVHLGGGPHRYRVEPYTPMSDYHELHEELHRRRERARATGAAGPRVVVCGATDTGKSTVTKTLLNYALLCDERPVHVDLNVGQNKISVPGTIAATRLEKQCLSMEDETFPLSVPVVYSVGATTFQHCPAHHGTGLHLLATSVKQAMAEDASINASGCVVNTCGWVENEGYKFLVRTVEELDADVVVVLSNDQRLATKLESEWGKEAPTIYQCAVSTNVLTRDQQTRKARRQRRICDYFFGPYALSRRAVPSVNMNEYTETYPLHKVHVYQITERNVSKRFQPRETATDIWRLNGGDIPRHALLAVPSPQAAHTKHSKDWLLSAETKAFVYVVNVSVRTNEITLLHRLITADFELDLQWLVASPRVTWNQFDQHMGVLYKPSQGY